MRADKQSAPVRRPITPVLFHTTQRRVSARSDLHLLHRAASTTRCTCCHWTTPCWPSTPPPPHKSASPHRTLCSTTLTPTQHRTSTTSSWPRKRFYLQSPPVRAAPAQLRCRGRLLGLHPLRDFLGAAYDGVRRVRAEAVGGLGLAALVGQDSALIICVASLIAVIPQIGATTICQQLQPRTVQTLCKDE